MNNIVFDSSSRRFLVSGDLNFVSIPKLSMLGQQLMDKDSELVFDFKSASCSDSSGLVLLTSLMRAAKALRKSICFINVPQQLLTIARTCNLDNILPIVTSHG